MKKAVSTPTISNDKDFTQFFEQVGYIKNGCILFPRTDTLDSINLWELYNVTPYYSASVKDDFIFFDAIDSVKLCKIFLQHIKPENYYKIKTILETNLPDLHKESSDFLKLPIGRVGVENVEFPLSVPTKEGKTLNTTANFNLFADLIDTEKGINMSRLPESLMESWVTKPISGRDFKELLKKMQKKMVSSDVYVSASFKLPLKRQAPASKRNQYVCFNCRLIGTLCENKHNLILEVIVPVASYCPCSKRMATLNETTNSGYGAHAQRCNVTLQIRIDNPSKYFIWFEDLIALVESCGSSPLYTLLKRIDEQYVTVKGYAHPKFTEDIAREVASKVMLLKGVNWLRVKTAAQESLHPYQAVAILTSEKKNNRWVKSYKGAY